MKPTGEITRRIHERMKAGDRSAFDRFFERHAPRVLVYIHYNIGPRLRGKLEPEDILQNVYLRVLKSFPAFSARAAERGVQKTLLRMAEHEITEAYRYHFKVDKRSARREVLASYIEGKGEEERSLLDWIPDAAASLSQRVIQKEEYQRLMAVLRKLTPLEQYVTVARVIEGVPSKKIAEETGRSDGAIRMMILRVREKLRKGCGADGSRG
jgi:RNA polymerase sigma-70 factor (ECF subfamily)